MNQLPLGSFWAADWKSEVETVVILGFVLPDHLIGGGVDFHDGAAVGAGAMRAVVEDGDIAVGQPFHVVRAEKHLIAVVVVAGRSLAHAVGGGVAIAPDDLLGLAVDDIDSPKSRELTAY